MVLLSALVLVVIGVLSAAPLIIAKRPDAKEAIAKLAAYQGWIGVGAALWGAWGVLQSLSNIDQIGLAWIIGLAVAVVTLLNGFLLGFALGVVFVGDENAKEKAFEFYDRLLPFQTRLGLAAIALGLLGAAGAILIH